MPLETGTYISDLDASNPLGSDQRSEGDNHLRLIKSVVQSTFPNADKSFRFPTTKASKTASFVVTFPDDQNTLYSVDDTAGAITVTLPDPTSGGTSNEDGFALWFVKTAGGNNIVLDGSGAQTINGAATFTITDVGQFVYLVWRKAIGSWRAFSGGGLNAFTPSAGTALTAPAVDDKLIIEDTSASNLVKYITLLNLLKIIDALTAETAPATGDELAMYDVSEGATNKITLSDVLKVINALTEDTDPDHSADFLLTYDVSASGVKKAIFGNFSATQAEMEAHSATTPHVTPGRQHFHPGHPKAGGNFNGSGTPAFASGDIGMGAITDGGVGLWTLALDTAFNDTNYWVTAWSRRSTDSSDHSGVLSADLSDTKTSSSFQVRGCQASTGSSQDNPENGITFWGDYA